MLHQLPITLDAPAAATMAAVFCGGACIIARARKINLPRTSVTLAIAGLICLTLAAGRARWQLSTVPRVAVMVDVSASTRTATYHDTDILARRLDQLLGNTPYTLIAFAEQSVATDLAQLPQEAPSRRTLFEIPSADAIVLFSDARFDPPITAPPIYPIVDPALDQVDDSAITRLDADGGTLAITARAAIEPRDIELAATATTTLTAPAGETVLRAAVDPAAAFARATIKAADAWPENNSMTIAMPPPKVAQRWWVTRDTSSAPSQGWRVMSPAQLPTDGTPLGVAVIVLDNIPADLLPRPQHDRLDQFVRELGGGLVILGGDGAFAAGGYAGTFLERLSPLSCNPPGPATHWVLLIDSSGSMSQTIGDNTRWNFAASAMLNLVPMLPPGDTLSIGDFARDIRWWSAAKSIAETNLTELLPKDVSPTGPTNLEPALRQLAQSTDGKSPMQAIIITDAEAAIADAPSLAAELARKRVRVSVLSYKQLPQGSPLHQIVQDTHGHDLAQADPREWSHSLRTLLRDASTSWLDTTTLDIEFAPEAGDFPPLAIAPWNRTWRKNNATELAVGHAGDNEPVPAIAAWNIRSGAVLAAAFRPPTPLAQALAEIVAMPPHDPRYTVGWDTGKSLTVTLDAVDGQRFMNNLAPQLIVVSESTYFTFTQSLTQTAPGRYSITLPPPRRSILATVTLDSKPIDRVAIAERYVPEFNAIGNDRANMRRLAQLSGGEVIEPTRGEPITLPRRTKPAMPITSPLAISAIALIAASIARWKLG
jgi:hypothetical protein